ncbi:MAG: hypothetical protein AAB447_00655 [Patescibacteria group bacterium]
MSLMRMGGVVTRNTPSGIEYRVIDFNRRVSIHIPLNQPAMINRPQGEVLREIQEHFLGIERRHHAEHTALAFSQPETTRVIETEFLCVDLQVTPYGMVECPR